MKSNLMVVCIFVFLIIFNVFSSAHADLIIYPKDVKDWEFFNKHQLQVLQKEVDDGHQPWRSSPADYAAVLVESYYGLKGEDTGLLPDGKEIKVGERSAIVEFDYKGKKHIVELEAPVKPHSKEGIWIVKKMTIIDKMGNLKNKKIKFFEKSLNCDVSGVYPQFYNSKIPHESLQKVNTEIKEFAENLFMRFLSGDIGKKSKEELKTDNNGDSFDVNFKVAMANTKYVSVIFETYFMPKNGPHGVGSFYAFNYDVEHSRIIQLKDFFKTGTNYLKQLNNFSNRGLEKKIGKGNYTEDAVTDKAQFTFDNKNLTIHFSAYEVVCYIGGMPEIMIPFKKLMGLQDK